MSKIFFTLLLFISVSGVADDEIRREVDLGGGRLLLYQGELDGRYQSLALVNNGDVLRKLYGVADKGGLFEYDEFPTVSSDGRYAAINQVESGCDEGKVFHEVAYCELIDLRSGCIVARDTGQFCGGEFTGSGEWRTSVLEDLNLLEVTPNAEKYVIGRMRFSDSPGDSLENLLVCDPIDDGNIKYYMRLARGETNGLNGGMQSKLRELLGVDGH